MVLRKVELQDPPPYWYLRVRSTTWNHPSRLLRHPFHHHPRIKENHHQAANSGFGGAPQHVPPPPTRDPPLEDAADADSTSPKNRRRRSSCGCFASVYSAKRISRKLAAPARKNSHCFWLAGWLACGVLLGCMYARMPGCVLAWRLAYIAWVCPSCINNNSDHSTLCREECARVRSSDRSCTSASILLSAYCCWVRGFL